MSRDERLVGEIAIYARSSKKQARAAVKAQNEETRAGSVFAQVNHCKEWLRLKFGEGAGDRATMFADEGFSGPDTSRPQFQHLLQEVRSGRVLVVVVAELSRITRSVRELVQVIEVLDRHGVQMVSLREGLDTGTPQGRLLASLLMALDDFEREQMARRSRLVARVKAEAKALGRGRAEVPHDQG